MSQHHFRTVPGRSRAAIPANQRVLADCGIDAHVVVFDDPAADPRGWFAGPNWGAPFDAALEREAIAALRTAGLWAADADGVEGPIPRQVRGPDRWLAVRAE